MKTDLTYAGPVPSQVMGRSHDDSGDRRHLIHGKAALVLFRIGAGCMLGGAVAIAHGGAVIVAIGALIVVPFIRERLDQRGARRRDRADASVFRAALASGHSPEPVAPVALAAGGQHLEVGETCFTDGSAVEVLSYFGDALIQRRGFFLFFGGPLAWTATAVGNLWLIRGNRKLARKAAPRWRDPEAARLWVTSERLILHGQTGKRSWVQLRYEYIAQCQLEADGVVLTLDIGSETPMKLKMRGPASHHALIKSLMSAAVHDRT